MLRLEVYNHLKYSIYYAELKCFGKNGLYIHFQTHFINHISMHDHAVSRWQHFNAFDTWLLLPLQTERSCQKSSIWRQGLYFLRKQLSWKTQHTNLPTYSLYPMTEPVPSAWPFILHCGKSKPSISTRLTRPDWKKLWLVTIDLFCLVWCNGYWFSSSNKINWTDK